MAVVTSLVVLGYDIFFEVLASGRTPGKRLNGFASSAQAVSRSASCRATIRNVLRLVDFLPFAYVLGAATILATRKNQRLGESPPARSSCATVPRRPRPAVMPHRRRRPRCGNERDHRREVAAVRRFLERRPEIDPAPAPSWHGRSRRDCGRKSRARGRGSRRRTS